MTNTDIYPKNNINDVLFDKSAEGRTGFTLPEDKLPEPKSWLPDEYKPVNTLPLPELAELDVARHMMYLSHRTFSVDEGFYPLGSCTMKYNPWLNEDMAALPAIAHAHPLAPVDHSQGLLQIIHVLQDYLARIFGMDMVSLQPAAGAHGEFAGMLVFRAYFEDKGDTCRKFMLVPDSAHGTNPASAAMAGFTLIPLKSNDRGVVDPAAVRDAIKTYGADCIAGIMMTNPNTLGIFETHIQEIAKILKEIGAQLYYDGANLNATLGLVRPGDTGFDLMHMNTHKTFSTPHGGGGPGSGPIGVKSHLAPFLPAPMVTKKSGRYELYNPAKTIGRMKCYYGNYGVLVRSLSYLLMLGEKGLREVTENAIINANYLQARIKDTFLVPFGDIHCMHEFVASAEEFKNKYEVRAMDFAKHLLERGVHAPTVYFPLIVHEAMMMEPTETESKQTLDYFADLLLAMAKEIENDAAAFKAHEPNLVINHPDEAKAARQLDVRWKPSK